MVGHSKEGHKKTRLQQKQNADKFHHPEEKIKQLEKFKHFLTGDILEVFAGQGNLTKYYLEHGNVTPMTKDEFGSSFDAIYKMRSDKKNLM